MADQHPAKATLKPSEPESFDALLAHIRTSSCAVDAFGYASDLFGNEAYSERAQALIPNISSEDVAPIDRKEPNDSWKWAAVLVEAHFTSKNPGFPITDIKIGDVIADATTLYTVKVKHQKTCIPAKGLTTP